MGGDRECKCSSGREVYDWKKVGGSKEKANSAASTTFHVGLHRAPVPLVLPVASDAQPVLPLTMPHNGESHR